MPIRFIKTLYTVIGLAQTQRFADKLQDKHLKAAAVPMKVRIMQRSFNALSSHVIMPNMNIPLPDYDLQAVGLKRRATSGWKPSFLYALQALARFYNLS